MGTYAISCKPYQDLKRGQMSKDLSDELSEVYKLFIEVMENPVKCGYLTLMSKLKPTSKALVDLKLLDRKNKIDWRMKRLIEDILRIMDFE